MHQISRVLYFAQITITVLLGVLVFGFCFYVGSAVLWSVMVAMLIAAVAYAYVQRTQMQRNVATVFPVFGVAMLYTFITLMVTLSNIAVSLPYNANKLLVQVQPAPIYVFQLDIVARELGLYNTSPCYAVNDMAELPTTGAPYYLLLRAAHISQLGQRLGTVEQIGQGNWVVHKTGTLPQLLKLAKGKGMLEDIRVVRISPTH